jgi:hypothetical protein
MDESSQGTQEVPQRKPRVAHKPANRCTKCGFRIRGSNHEDGPHCRSGKNGSAKIE